MLALRARACTICHDVRSTSASESSHSSGRSRPKPAALAATVTSRLRSLAVVWTARPGYVPSCRRAGARGGATAASGDAAWAQCSHSSGRNRPNQHLPVNHDVHATSASESSHSSGGSSGRNRPNPAAAWPSLGVARAGPRTHCPDGRIRGAVGRDLFGF